MDAAYLKENIGDVLALGLTQTLVRQPEDSVEYLANWLLDYVNNQEKETKKKEYMEEIVTKDDLLKKKEAKLELLKEQEKTSAIEDATKRGDLLTTFLKNASSVNGLLQQFTDLLKDSTSSNDVYISRLQNDVYDIAGGEASNTERDPSLDYLKYIVTSDSNKDMLLNRVNAGEGITLDLFEQDEALPDEYEEYYDEESGEYLQRLLPKPEQPPKTVFVPNVLVNNNRIKLFNLPRVGCFLGVRVQYESCLHDLIFDEAEIREQEITEQEKEEEERIFAEEEEKKITELEEEEERRRIREEEDEYMTPEEKLERDHREEEELSAKLAGELDKIIETDEEREERLFKENIEKLKEREEKLIESLTKRKVGYVVCIDTIGQDRRLTDVEVNTALRLSRMLENTLVRLDRKTFQEEYKLRAELRSINEMHAFEPLNEEDRMVVLEQQYEHAKRIVVEGEKTPTRDDVKVQHRQHLLVEKRDLVLQLNNYNVIRGPVQVLQGLLYLLGYPYDAIADNDNHTEWSKIRNLIDEELVARIEELDVRAKYAESIVDSDPTLKKKKAVKVEENTVAYYTSIEGIEQLIVNVDVEDLIVRNPILHEIHGFILDAINLYKRADKEHRRYMATERARIKAEKEEEERIRLEEEEAAREAAEAAAAAAEEDEDFEE